MTYKRIISFRRYGPYNIYFISFLYEVIWLQNLLLTKFNIIITLHLADNKIIENINLEFILLLNLCLLL